MLSSAHLRRRRHHLVAIGALMIAAAMVAPTLATIIDGGDGSGDGGIGEYLPQEPTSRDARKKCTDVFSCTLVGELERTHYFLAARKSDEGITPDPRPLTPVSEMIRLNVMTQAHGYLNLYLLTGRQQYRRESEDRLRYMLAHPDDSAGPLMGYTFLVASEAYKNPAYRDFGMRAAETCRTEPAQKLNWGYMCAMVMGKAFQLTGDVRYRDKAREVTAKTNPEQHAIGSFPHNAGDGPNLAYSAWLMEEAVIIRQLDPGNPDVDIQLLKSRDFFRQRVNADGSLSFEDANGRYDYNAGIGNVRGWTNNLAPVAFVLKSLGDEVTATRVLRFLFSQRMTGNDAGGYPDKYDNFEPDSIWASGRPSVLRTSLIFWDLSTIALAHSTKGSCTNGATSSCGITPSNCHPAFAAKGLCNAGLSGTSYCVDGRQTSCVNVSMVRYETVACGESFIQCTGQPNCWNVCTPVGPRQCIGSECGACLEVYGLPSCEQQCSEYGLPEQC